MFARAHEGERKKERERELSLSFFCVMVRCISVREKESNGASAPKMNGETTESENLSPRCRELVACSQVRFRDKIIYELARSRSPGGARTE